MYFLLQALAIKNRSPHGTTVFEVNVRDRNWILPSGSTNSLTKAQFLQVAFIQIVCLKQTVCLKAEPVCTQVKRKVPRCQLIEQVFPGLLDQVLGVFS